MRVSFSACSSPVVVTTSVIGPSRTIRSTRRPVGESGSSTVVWWTIRPSLMRVADKHGKRAVLVRLQLVRFIDEKDGVSEGTVVINQGQRAAARQVVHEVRADQLQRSCRRERFAALLAPFTKRFSGCCQDDGSWRRCSSTRSARVRSRHPWTAPAEQLDPSGLAPARVHGPLGHSASRCLAFSAGVNGAGVVSASFLRAACARSAAHCFASLLQVLPNARFPPSCITEGGDDGGHDLVAGHCASASTD